MNELHLFTRKELTAKNQSSGSPTMRRPAIVARILLAIMLLWLQLTPASTHAQEDKEIKWGEIPREELMMNSFPEDTNATAIILADVGRVHFVNDFHIVFERHRRIKILSTAGYDWGDHTITYYAAKGLQKVSGVKGHTIILQSNGKERKVELDKNSKFDEDVDGEYRRVRFTLPALAPGCIVEYRYKVESRYPTFLRDWRFQTSEPTRWSDFRVEIPDVLEYVRVGQGITSFHITDTERLSWQPTLDYHETARAYNLGVTRHRWVMRDLPALREEPFMTTPDDFRAKMQFQLSRIKWPGQRAVEVMHTWEKLAEELTDSDKFGKQIEKHKVLRAKAEEVVAGLTDPKAKMLAIYDYVRQTMKWNNEYGIYVDQDLDKAFEARSGGGPEIALILTGILRFAGLEAHPVLSSTRKHGRVIDIYPILSQFNHVMTYLEVAGESYLLDATDPLRAYSILPVATLNEVGWLVNRENPSWIKIVSPGAFVNKTIVLAELSEAGAVKGHFQSMDDGYSCLFNRHTLKDKDQEDYVRDGWLKHFAGAELDSFAIGNLDTIDVPLITDADFSASEHCLVAGDKIYFNPMFFGRREENPFKLENRTFPVDFAYAQNLGYTLNLTLPAGFEVEEYPRDLVLNLANRGGRFSRRTTVSGNLLQMMCEFQISQTFFRPQEYANLRDFYDQVAAAHAEQVVLQRQSAIEANGDSD